MLPSPSDGVAASFSKRYGGDISQRDGSVRIGDKVDVGVRQHSSSRLERVALPKPAQLDSSLTATTRAAAPTANGDVSETPWQSHSVPPLAAGINSSVQVEEPTDSTWLARVTDRANDLRKLFDLPATENVMDDFVCALQKRILLPGRLYVFEHYVCFHANVFGYVKKIIIPLKEVTAVHKRTNLGLSNSIEIMWRDKRAFFTSFLSREDAYRLIMADWAQCSGYAKLFTGMDPEPEPSRQRGGVCHTRSMPAAELNAILQSSDDGEGGTSGINRDSFVRKSASLLLRPIVARLERTAEGVPLGGAEGGASVEPRRRRSAEPAGAPLSDEVLYEEAERALSHSTKAETEEEAGPGDQNDSDDEDESLADEDVWTAVPEPPPALKPGMQLLVDREIVGVDVHGFCTHIMADNKPFFTDVHVNMGDEQVQLSPWRSHHSMGRVRELQFVAKVKSRIGPPKTMCYQTHRCTMYKDDHFVFETFQVMPDIPYGDCFTVEARWDICPKPAVDGIPRVKIQAHVMVSFTKTTIWRRAIESGVIASCKTAHEECVLHAQAAVDALGEDAMGAVRQLRARSSSPDLRASRSSRRSAAGDERVRTARVGAPLPPARSGARAPSSTRGAVQSTAVAEAPASRSSLSGTLSDAEEDAKMRRGPTPKMSPSLLSLTPGGKRQLSPIPGSRAGTPGHAAPALWEASAAGRGAEGGSSWKGRLLALLCVCVMILQVAVLYALLTAKGGVLSDPPAPGPGSGSALAGSGAVLGESVAGGGDYWASRYALLQHDVHTMQVRMEAIAKDVAVAMSALRAEGSDSQRGAA